ncbi:MAG: assimilatory sulfite reductase (NADPH) flavoprotein subunit [Akkermansiaceae bacterium]
MVDLPQHAPLDDAQRQKIQELSATLTPQQAAWVSGYFAGTSGAVGAAPAAVSQKKITVLYGTESGNCEELADQLFKSAKQKGFKPRVTNMADAKVADLKDAGNLLVVVSTWGDGEPPEAAEEFYNELMASDVSLDGVEFSVCALGDTSYDQFCQTGKEVDVQLEKLGAKRFADRVDCDVDYDDAFANWSKSIWANLGEASTSATAAVSAAPAQTYDRKNPFSAEVLQNQLLSGDRSNKETIHVELSLEGSGFNYQPGDVLAVLPRNAKDVVDEVLAASGLAANASVEIKGIGRTTLGEALTTQLDITGLSRKVVSAWQQISGSERLASLLQDTAKSEFKEWADGRQIIDLLEDDPAENLTAQQLVDILRKLPPRLYSIASSPKAHPDEVHLTVAAVRYDTHDKSRKGVASTFLADDAPTGSKVSVYVHPNKNFRLPENGDTPIIMVGPGTGIAPFRAFVEERAESGDKGDCWLFFGDQHYNEDFLYQLEWQDHLKNDALGRLDVAFSRDQPEKIYVQHKMLENAAEIWQWLEKGAHFYVCGDATRMAKDVHDALLEIIGTQGDMNADEADAYLAALKKEKRYQRDVY